MKFVSDWKLFWFNRQKYFAECCNLMKNLQFFCHFFSFYFKQFLSLLHITSKIHKTWFFTTYFFTKLVKFAFRPQCYKNCLLYGSLWFHTQIIQPAYHFEFLTLRIPQIIDRELKIYKKLSSYAPKSWFLFYFKNHSNI